MAPAPNALAPGTSLDGELQTEVAARQHDAETVTLEQVMASLKRDGVGLGRQTPIVARTQLAIYCGRVDSLDGMIITVCEYPSMDKAYEGERAANVTSNQVPGHTSRVRGKSVLHLIRQTTTPEDSVQKVYRAFAGLIPDAGG